MDQTGAHPKNSRFWGKLAGALASSFLLAKGRRLFEANTRDWNLPLSKLGKLQAGLYIILKDYSAGLFPPTFDDQAKAYQAERDFLEQLPGFDAASAHEGELRKPFWDASNYARYSRHFARLMGHLEQLGLKPGHRLLELGCGTGWMSEFLAIAGYRMVGTSIAPGEIELAQKRLAACQAKGLPNELRFVACPMESVDESVGEREAFDGVFVFEALHHAFDWRMAIQAASRCLKPGGWLLLANEPNWLHTAVSYRVARLAKIHEVGMVRQELIGEMRRCGLTTLRVFAPKFNDRVRPHWIAGQKSGPSAS